MSRESLKSRTILHGIILSVLVFMAVNIFVFYQRAYASNPIIQQNISSFNIGYVYDFYVSSTPTIDGRSYYGGKNASITIIAFMDIGSESSKYFIREMLPQIEHDYINTGEAKIYFKNYITAQDFHDKNERFLYAEALSCIESEKKESYYQFYFDLFGINGTKEFKNLLDKNKTSHGRFDACIKKQDYKNILIDMYETENFGIIGATPRFYIGLDGRDNSVIEGVPTYAKFKRAIKEYEVTIGE